MTEIHSRVVQVVAGLDPGEGGPVHTLPPLWTHLGEAGVEVRAYTTVAAQGEEAVMTSPGERVELMQVRRGWPAALKRAPSLERRLDEAMRDADLCHNHGCWLHPNWVAARVARRARKPLVISPLGHLDEWSLRHHGWRKQWVRALIEEANWRYCSAFVAKSEEEATGLRKLGLGQRVRVIPNGIDAAEWSGVNSPEAFWRQFPAVAGKRVALFLSRIHPKKGLPLLLQAWQEAMGRRPDWVLVVAGDYGNLHGETLREWAAIAFEPGRVLFTGALDGKLKRSALSAASVFVLPSHSENFGQVVLEALAAGCPVIVTRGCPWREVEQRGCGWWVEGCGRAIAAALEEVARLEPEELKARGERGREWVRRDFEWGRIVRSLLQVYREVLAGR